MSELSHRSRILAIPTWFIIMADGSRCLTLAAFSFLGPQPVSTYEGHIHSAEKKYAESSREILLEAFVQLFFYK